VNELAQKYLSLVRVGEDKRSLVIQDRISFPTERASALGELERFLAFPKYRRWCVRGGEVRLADTFLQQLERMGGGWKERVTVLRDTSDYITEKDWYINTFSEKNQHNTQAEKLQLAAWEALQTPVLARAVRSWQPDEGGRAGTRAVETTRHGRVIQTETALADTQHDTSSHGLPEPTHIASARISKLEKPVRSRAEVEREQELLHARYRNIPKLKNVRVQQHKPPMVENRLLQYERVRERIAEDKRMRKLLLKQDAQRPPHGHKEHEVFWENSGLVAETPTSRQTLFDQKLAQFEKTFQQTLQHQHTERKTVRTHELLTKVISEQTRNKRRKKVSWVLFPVVGVALGIASYIGLFFVLSHMVGRLADGVRSGQAAGGADECCSERISAGTCI
jgi:hypothetical protein